MILILLIIIIVLIVAFKLLYSNGSTNGHTVSNLSSNDSEVVLLASIFKKLAPTNFDSVSLRIKNGSISHIFFIDGVESPTYEFLLGKHASSEPLFSLTTDELIFIKRHTSTDSNTWWIKTSPGFCSPETMREIYNNLSHCSDFQVNYNEGAILAEKPEK